MKKSLSPEEIVLLPNFLAIRWNNKQESVLPFVLLRAQCPCAFCSGEVDALGNKYGGNKPTPNQNVLIIQVECPVSSITSCIIWGLIIPLSLLILYEFLINGC